MRTALPASFVLLAAVATQAQDSDDFDRLCKAGLYNCGCKLDESRHFESKDHAKLAAACWGDLAKFNVPKGKKAEVMDRAFAEAEKAKKIVLYIGNTGG
jgi:hypothetical protein